MLNATASAAAHRPFSFVQHKYLYTHLERRKRLRRWVDVKIRHNIPGQSVPSMRPAGVRKAQTSGMPQCVGAAVGDVLGNFKLCIVGAKMKHQHDLHRWHWGSRSSMSSSTELIGGNGCFCNCFPIRYKRTRNQFSYMFVHCCERIVLDFSFFSSARFVV